ncbi:hypothetical protein DFH07DRAFT_779896 [Mycena maculata]|uniref:Uncharacterized protein n=1 Tax=Mycena maculata TaxID=230809 RepID=A0AAD7I7K6_9AGAR|nr:hypothetical protein DFH07DRAFT_779896 [Mycena maculata]
MSSLRATLLTPDLGFSTNQVLPGIIGGATPTSSATMLGSEVNSLNNASLLVVSSSPIESIAPAGAVTGEIRAPVGAVANDTLKEIQLLIDDARPTRGIVNTLQHIRVKYIDSEDCRLSEYFVQITANEPLVFETQLLVIPKDDSLNLCVLRIPQAVIRPVDPDINWDSLIASASASAAKGSAPVQRNLLIANWSGSKPKSRRCRATQSSRPIVTNLYKTLTVFAFNADKKFYSTSPTGLPIFRHPRSAIFPYASLCNRIHYSAEVVAQISKSDEKDPKATVLKGFLIQWEKDHPVTK